MANHRICQFTPAAWASRWCPSLADLDSFLAVSTFAGCGNAAGSSLSLHVGFVRLSRYAMSSLRCCRAPFAVVHYHITPMSAPSIRTCTLLIRTKVILKTLRRVLSFTPICVLPFASVYIVRALDRFCFTCPPRPWAPILYHLSFPAHYPSSHSLVCTQHKHGRHLYDPHTPASPRNQIDPLEPPHPVLFCAVELAELRCCCCQCYLFVYRSSIQAASALHTGPVKVNGITYTCQQRHSTP